MSASAEHLLTAADVGAFLDELVPQQLLAKSMAGAVVVVVKDGRILFGRGYGYADIEKKRPVSVDETLFRVGSISKLFTWTAVMQLYEQGRLSLDTDVNAYLDFRIPDAFSTPITLRNLMTHTSGFEDTVKDLAVAHRSDLEPLGVYLSKHVPRRIFPPGTTPAYSNYGGALAGYIVERVSGEKFDQYVHTHILKPLGMTRSSFQEPLPSSLSPLLSQGYLLASQAPRPVEILQAGPAGSLSTTAGDMARFMIAHLQEGRFEGAQILKAETVRMMHSRQFGLHPELNGMALGFYEQSRNGHRIIGHGGDSICFVSDFQLIIDAGVGFFVSYNSQGTDNDEAAPQLLWQLFIDRYFRSRNTAAPAIYNAPVDRNLQGVYFSTRRSDASLLRFSGIWQGVRVSALSDRTLVIDSFNDPEGKSIRWEPIGRGLYQAVGGEDRIAFVNGPAGQLILGLSSFPPDAYERIPGRPARIQIVFLALAVGGIFSVVVVLAVWTLFRRRSHTLAAFARFPFGRWWVVRSLCMLNLCLMFAWGVFLVYTLHTAATNFDMTPLSHNLDRQLHVMQVLNIVGALGLLPACACAYQVWTDSISTAAARAFELVILAAFVGFGLLLFECGLLDFSLRY